MEIRKREYTSMDDGSKNQDDALLTVDLGVSLVGSLSDFCLGFVGGLSDFCLGLVGGLSGFLLGLVLLLYQSLQLPLRAPSGIDIPWHLERSRRSRRQRA